MQIELLRFVMKILPIALRNELRPWESLHHNGVEVRTRAKAIKVRRVAGICGVPTLHASG
jgi:hypothetical protein